MNPRPLVLVLALLAWFNLARAADVAWVGATAYPAPDAEPVPDAVLLVRDGRIAAFGSRAQVSVPADARVVDCTGRFITAGFWNSHVHILTPELLHAQTMPAAALNASLARMFTRWGFTTVFDLASSLDNTLALRARIETGELRGPRLLTTGEPLWTAIPIYVRQYLAEQNIAMPPTTTAAAAVERTRALVDRGVDGIKLFTGSIQPRGAIANMPLDLVRAAAAEAHRHRLPVFSHPQNQAGLDAAIAGGVDILAHTAPQSPAWTPEFATRLKDAHIALIPTLTLFRVELEKDHVPAPEIERWLEHAIVQVRSLHAVGGEILFGTDIGYIDYYDTAEEFRLLARAGLGFRDILTSLTTAPARRFGVAERSGWIAVGYDADFVVLADDPAKDVTALSRVNTTVRQGRVLFESH